MAKQDEYVRITTRIPPELHEALVNQANRTERSLNGELVAILQSGINRAEEEARPYMANQTTGEYNVAKDSSELMKLIERLPPSKKEALFELLKK